MLPAVAIAAVVLPGWAVAAAGIALAIAAAVILLVRLVLAARAGKR